MSYRVVVDSCCEMPERYKKDPRVIFVPLGLEVGDYQIMDDENFNQHEFLQKVAACSTCPKSSCPSPEKYMDAYSGDVERVYVVTLSGRLSGSYNSAVLGKNLYEEMHGERDICVIDSKSASGGEAQIALLAIDLEEQGLSFAEISKRLEEKRDEQGTYFILDNLDTLRKNGRLTGVKALVASTLNIKPVMAATEEGEIVQLGQAVGINKAMKKLGDYVIQGTKNSEAKRLVITHCNAPERAEYMQKLLSERAKFREIEIMDMAGISTMYANDGGIIITV